MQQYLIRICLFRELPGSNDGELVTSAPGRVIDEWLEEHDMPRLFEWRLVAQACPGNTDVFNSVHYERDDLTLIVEINALTPVDPIKLRLFE
jgi:hypothetical protein